MSDPIIIYGATMSFFVRKVMAFAAEKGIDVKLVPTTLREGGYNPDFLAISPFRKMPALRDGDFTVSDSTAIIHYLDTLHPEPNLIPTEAKARARTIWFEEYGDTLLCGCVGKMFLHRIANPRFFGKPGDESVALVGEGELPGVLDYLEGVIPASGFLVEDRLTLADLAVASPFVNLMHLGLFPDAAAYPKTVSYVNAILARPSLAVWVAKETAFFNRAA